MEPIQAKLSIVADKLHLKNFTEDLNLEEHFVCVADVNRPALQLNGFYEHFEADRIQMIGMVEHAYMNNKTAECGDLPQTAFLRHTVCDLLPWFRTGAVFDGYCT